MSTSAPKKLYTHASPIQPTTNPGYSALGIYPDQIGSTLTGTNGSDSIQGGSEDDTLKGLNGNDTLNGGAGADALIGGAGNDTYIVDNLADQVVEALNQGVDLVSSTVSFTLAANVENLILTGANNIDATGNASNNHLTGNAKNNHLVGLAGVDFLDGGAGDDTLEGGAGRDTLDGGLGVDTLIGGVGNDVYHVNCSDDVVIENAREGVDSVYAVANFTLASNLENLILTGTAALNGTGNAQANGLQGNAGANVLNAGAGQDTLAGGEGADTLIGGWGDDTYYLEHSIQTLVEVVDQGNDTVITRIDAVNLTGTHLENLTLVAGAVTGLGSEQANLLTGSQVANSLHGNGGDDTLNGAGGDDTLSGGLGNDALEGGTGHDVLLGEQGDDTLSGGNGNDRLNGGQGNNLLLGGSGNDTLSSGSDPTLPGHDTLDGGAGEDTLEGGSSNTTYRFGLGSGQDRVYESGGSDTVEFTGSLTAADVQVAREEGDSLVLRLNSEDSLTLSSYFGTDGEYAVETFRFSDGTVLDAATVRALVKVANDSDQVLYCDGALGDSLSGLGGNDTLNGDVGNDTLDGDSGNDLLTGNAGNNVLLGGLGNDTLDGDDGHATLDGGAGDDVLSGANGNTTYRFGLGYGHDVVFEAGGRDTVRFTGSLTTADVQVACQGSSLVLRLNSEDSLTLLGYFSTNSNAVETFRFSDGTVLDATAIQAWVTVADDSDQTMYGYDTRDDNLSGQGGNDTLYGQAGNDTLDGGSGNDSLDGGQGNNLLLGGLGDDILGNLISWNSNNPSRDTLDGGAGKDNLHGGYGDTTYLFGRGSGRDTVYDAGGSDTVQFTGSLTAADVQLSRSGTDLVVSLANSEDSLRFYGYFSSGYAVENFQFSDGSSLNQAGIQAWVNMGTDSAQLLIGQDATNDSLSGLGGNDTLYGANGADTLEGGSGNDWLYGQDGGDWLAGGAGRDSAYGGAGNDTFSGGAGDDYLEDSVATQDVYLFGKGDGSDVIADWGGTDTLRLADGVSTSEVLVTRYGNDLILTVNTTGDSVRVSSYFTSANYQVENITFADGTTWDNATVQTKVDEISHLTVSGTDNADFLVGANGHDTLNGNAGADTLDGGAGSDRLNAGDGNDSLLGGVGNDTLDGGIGDDTLDAGSGNDTISEFDGNDTYRFGVGCGRDTLVDWGGTDTVVFTGTLTAADVQVARQGRDLVLSLANSEDSLTLQNYFDDGRGGNTCAIETFLFSSGGTLDSATIRALATAGNDSSQTLLGYTSDDTLSGLGGNDTLDGNAGNDTLDGGAGDDTLYDKEGNDLLLGGTGRDFLWGYGSQDTLDGGAGDDTLDGGGGNTTYRFGLGAGHDTVDDSGGSDTVEFTGSLTAADVQMARQGDSLVLRLNSEDSLTLLSYFSTRSDCAVEAFLFANGTVLDTAAIATLVTMGDDSAQALYGDDNSNDRLNGLGGNDTLYGQAGNDTLSGDSGNDSLDGGQGNNLLLGGAGNDTLGSTLFWDSTSTGRDTLAGGAGDDSLSGTYGDTTYLFGLGSDHDRMRDFGGHDTVQFTGSLTAADVQVARQGDNLVLRLNSEDSLTLEGYFFNYAVETFRFANGTTLDVATIQALVTMGDDSAQTLYCNDIHSLSGLGGNDTLYGQAGNDTLDGGSGHDSLDGGQGNNLLLGGSGNDTLNNSTPGNGDNTLDGGAGDDVLNDGSYTVWGNTTYRFGVGSGHDTLTDWGGSDTVALTGSLTAADVQLTRSGDSLLLSLINSDDTLQVSGYFSGSTGNNVGGNWTVETLQFTTGGVLDVAAVKALVNTGTDFSQSLVGYDQADAINALDGHDTVNGLSGNDTLNAGAGDDVLYGGTDSDQLQGGADNDDLHGDDGIDSLYGGTGNDTLWGGAQHDWLQGDAGSDLIYADAGSDVVVLTSLDGFDSVNGFTTGTDKLRFNQSGVTVGNGNTTVDGATLQATGSGFASAAELVIITHSIAGEITTISAAAKIGSAASGYALDDTRLFVVNNGGSSAVFCFHAHNTDAVVSASELNLLAVLNGTPATVVNDYVFGS